MIPTIILKEAIKLAIDTLYNQRNSHRADNSTPVLLEYGPEKLTVTAQRENSFYREIYIEDATDIEHGRSLVNAKVLYSILDALNRTTTLTLKTTEQHLVISWGENYVKLPLLDISYSETPSAIEPLTQLPNFHKAVKMVTHSVSKRDLDPRLILTGVKIEVLKEGYRLITCDGIRLSIYTVGSGDLQWTVSVDSEIMCSIGKAIDDNVWIGKAENMVEFSWAGTRIFTSVIPGMFPDYTKVIPSTSLVKVDLNTASLLYACKILMTQPDTAIRLTTDDTLKVKASVTSFGEIILDESYASGPFKIALGPQYLAEFLAISGDKVRNTG